MRTTRYVCAVLAIMIGLGVEPIVVILIMMAILIVLGCLMDWIGICLLTMPIFVPMMAKQFEKRYDEFMAMSPEQQRAELDKRIDEMKARGGPGGPGGPGGGGNGGRRGPPNMDPKKAEQFRKKMLDWTTPEQRAKFENGINLMNGRLKERGMDPLPPGPGGGFF